MLFLFYLKGSESVSTTKKDEHGLTAREERFCGEYLIDFKEEKAALRAGFPEKSARTAAWRLLKKDEVCSRMFKSNDLL